jgi:hypothetical protein
MLRISDARFVRYRTRAIAAANLEAGPRVCTTVELVLPISQE